MTQSREGAVSCCGTQATPHAPHGAGEVRPGDRAGRGWVPARFRRWPSAVLRPGGDSFASAGVVTHCDPGLERDPAPQSAHCTAGTVFALEGFGTFLARGTPGPLLPGGRLPILVLHLTGFAPPPQAQPHSVSRRRPPLLWHTVSPGPRGGQPETEQAAVTQRVLSTGARVAGGRAQAWRRWACAAWLQEGRIGRTFCGNPEPGIASVTLWVSWEAAQRWGGLADISPRLLGDR